MAPKIIFLLLACVLLLVDCKSFHEEYTSNTLDSIKKNIDAEKCFVEGYDKFVSLVFFKKDSDSIVQVCTYIERPYNDYNKFYYKEDSDYIFVCAGFCEEFATANEFKEWNDSIIHSGFWSLLENSDDETREFYLKNNNFESDFYLYKANKFFLLDSLTYDEHDSIFSQLIRFDLGYRIPPPINPDESE